jgi:hypothetical protein
MLICSYNSGMRHIRQATRVRATDYLIQRLTPLVSFPVHSLIQQNENGEVIILLHVHDDTEFDPEAPDPFTISGYEEHRDSIKQCAYSIINASKRMSHYPENVDWTDGLEPPMRWRDMEEVIFTHVPLFERYAYKAIGLRLMRQESDILISVLLDLIEKDIGFLPMHDGIMVPENKERLTRDLVLKHYNLITGQRINVKRKEISRPPQEPLHRPLVLSHC